MCMCLQSMNLILENILTLNLSMLPLSTLTLSASSLRELNLGGCFALDDAGFHCDCPKLKIVDVCGTCLTETALEALQSAVPSTTGEFVIHKGGQPPLDWNRMGPQW